jgi:hypothetical protein
MKAEELVFEVDFSILEWFVTPPIDIWLCDTQTRESKSLR